jgi:hypothetical protein
MFTPGIAGGRKSVLGFRIFSTMNGMVGNLSDVEAIQERIESRRRIP